MSGAWKVDQLFAIVIGSSIAHYTGQTLYKKVLESKYFETKEYAKAMTDGFLALDKSLIEGMSILCVCLILKPQKK